LTDKFIASVTGTLPIAISHEFISSADVAKFTALLTITIDNWQQTAFNAATNVVNQCLSITADALSVYWYDFES
jgi:hypothetical protein